MNMLFYRYIQILGSQFGLWRSWPVQCSVLKYVQKAKQVNIKYTEIDFEILKNHFRICMVKLQRDRITKSKCNWSVYWDTCTNSEILKHNWCVSRYWCSWNAGLTPPHSLLPSKFFLLPSGWPEQWWTALLSLMMMMKKLPHLHPVHIRPASQKHLWRISYHVQHTLHSLHLPLQRRTFMSCKWRMKNCLRRYVCYEYLPLVITYFMQKMSILCIIYLCIMYITFWVVSSCYPIEITLYFSSFLVALRIQPNATPSSHGPVCGTLLQTLARSSGGRDLPAEQIL